MLRRYFFIFALLISSHAFAQTAGTVESMTEIGTYSIDVIKGIKAQLGITTPTTTSITAYKMRYYTTGLDGKITIASAAVTIPNETPVAQRPVISYQHGTTSNRKQVPSSGSTEVVINAAFYSSNGFVSVAADYLGLGDEPSFHPYLHADSEASASADALLAVYGAGLSTSKKLFLAGYSQGGHATMALHRFWQQKYNVKHPITASAPMAGPYDLSGSVILTANDITKVSESTVTYTGYLLLGMNSVYHLYSNLEDVVIPPYDAKLPVVLDGSLDFKDVAAQLPATLTEFLQPLFIDSIVDGAPNSFIEALRANDVYDWKPEAPVQFCQGDADLDVPPMNTVKAIDRMKALGATVTQAVIPTGLNHKTAGMPCFKASSDFIHSF